MSGMPGEGALKTIISRAHIAEETELCQKRHAVNTWSI